MHVDKYKQTGSDWKRFVGRDGGMKQKQSRWREAGQTKPTLDHLKRATRLDFMQKKKNFMANGRFFFANQHSKTSLSL